MAYAGMAYIGMAYTVMAYIAMAAAALGRRSGTVPAAVDAAQLWLTKGGAVYSYGPI